MTTRPADPTPASQSAASLPLGSGIVYAATMKDLYVEEAFLSAETVKQRFPGLPVTLFTDRPDHILCELGSFDRIEQVRPQGAPDVPCAQAQLFRLGALLNSPYKRTLHLDTDTRVLTEELPWLFKLLDQYDVAMVETSEDDSYSRRQLGRRMFNSGMILFRETTKTKQWLDVWHSITKRNFIAARQPSPGKVASLRHIASNDARRRLLYMDQVSLVEVLTPNNNPLGLQFFVLDPSWNHRGSKSPRNNRFPVKILHFPELRRFVHADIMAVAFAWKSNGRATAAESLYGYVAAQYPAGQSSLYGLPVAVNNPAR